MPRKPTKPASEIIDVTDAAAVSSRLSYGVSRMLYRDKGSAKPSTAILRWLNEQGVRLDTHAAGHAWVKGGVENANKLVELGFESRHAHSV